jgi:hypothetical protein
MTNLHVERRMQPSTQKIREERGPHLDELLATGDLS